MLGLSPSGSALAQPMQGLGFNFQHYKRRHGADSWQAPWYLPAVPATQASETGGWLEVRSLQPTGQHCKTSSQKKISK